MPTYTKATARLPVRLSQELLDAVRALAQAQGESLGSVVRGLLRQAVAEAEREQREKAEP
jgi:hypothetical protein